MLVTGIEDHYLLLFVDVYNEFINRISYPPIEKGIIYYMQGIISRKKQLIPYISIPLNSQQMSVANKARWS